MNSCEATHYARKVGLGEARDTTSIGERRYQVVGKFLQVSGSENHIVWVGNVGPLGANGKDYREDTHIVPANYHRLACEAIRRSDMGDAGGGKRTRGIGNPVR